jgi:hypothetical protein
MFTVPHRRNNAGAFIHGVSFRLDLKWIPPADTCRNRLSGQVVNEVGWDDGGAGPVAGQAVGLPVILRDAVKTLRLSSAMPASGQWWPCANHPRACPSSEQLLYGRRAKGVGLGCSFRIWGGCNPGWCSGRFEGCVLVDGHREGLQSGPICGRAIFPNDL